MRGSKRLAEEAIKAEMQLALESALTRMEIAALNRKTYVAFSCGNGACQVREFTGENSHADS